MGRVTETVKTVNSVVRTALATVLVIVSGVVGYQAYDVYNQPQKQLKQKQAELDKTLAKLDQVETDLSAAKVEVERLNTSLELLKIDQRVAELRILDQKPAAEEGEPVITTVQFVETDPEGKPIGEPRTFEVPGEQVYLEYLVVKFNDEYIEQADLERGTAICLFQRLFGSGQKPEEGFTIDQPNSRPTAYARGEQMSEFEKEIWSDFWDLAHDKERLEKMGIRNVMADAPSVKARPGSKYRLQIRTTGGFQLEHLPE